MDIKDNEHVLDTNHYRRVVEEYEKNFMNGFTKEQQEEIKEMGKNVKIRNIIYYIRNIYVMCEYKKVD